MGRIHGMESVSVGEGGRGGGGALCGGDARLISFYVTAAVQARRCEGVVTRQGWRGGGNFNQTKEE